jgi:hypothetical protein
LPYRHSRVFIRRPASTPITCAVFIGRHRDSFPAVCLF